MRVLVRRPIRDAKSVLSDSGGYASLHHRLISAAPPAQRLVGKLIAHAPRTVPNRLHHPSESLHDLARDVASGPIGVNIRPGGADRRQGDRAGGLLRIAGTGTHYL